MFTLFIVLHVIFCIFLILVILLQTGKGAGIGAAFGGGSQTVFGPRGAGSFIGKVTGAVAGLFMLTSMILAFLSTSRSDNVAKAVEALKAEKATAVENVSLNEPKDTSATPEAVPATATTGTDADTSVDGTDVKAETAGTDGTVSNDAAKDTEPKALDDEAAAPEAPAADAAKPAKATKQAKLPKPKPKPAAKAPAAATDAPPAPAPAAAETDPKKEISVPKPTEENAPQE